MRKHDNFYAMRSMMANVLRVMRGGGNPWQICGDIERIGQSTSEISGNSSERGAAVTALADGAGSWKDNIIDRLQSRFDERGRAYHMLSFEYDACAAALRMMAAEMDGNGTESSKASSDLWAAVRRYNSAIQAEEEARESAELEELSRQREKYMAADRRAAQHNKKTLAAANDNATCFVYFVTDGDAIKIGKAINPKSRLGGLQTSHYKPLRILGLIPGDEALERHLHGKFSRHHIRGEWFRDCKEIRSFIAKAANDNAATKANAA